MRKVYNIPLTGKVKRKYPLKGEEDEPIAFIPIFELVAEAIREEDGGPTNDYYFTATSLGEDIDRGIAIVGVEASPRFHEKLALSLNDSLEGIYQKTKSKRLIVPEGI